MRRLLALVLIAIIFTAGNALGAPKQKRYVFIDGGAHFGEAYTAFEKTGLYARYPWEIIAIEANPYLIAKLPSTPNLTVIPKAMWISDGTMEFFMFDETTGANSLFEKAKDGQPKQSRAITVKSFDFSQWLKNNFSKDDYLCVSLDIEGAEYEILEKMFRDGTISYADRLYVEFHSWKFPKEFEGKGGELLSKASQLGVVTENDSVEGVIKKGQWLDSIDNQQEAKKDPKKS